MTLMMLENIITKTTDKSAKMTPIVKSVNMTLNLKNDKMTSSVSRSLAQIIIGLMLTIIFQSPIASADLSCPPSCECIENNDQQLDVRCAYQSLKDIPSKLLPLSASTLDVSRNKLTSLKTLTFYNIRSLKSVNVSHNEVEDTEDGTFGFMRLLKTLDLSWNQLTVVRQGTFHGARSLQELYLSNNRLSGMAGAFDGMKDLTNLDLSDNHLTSITELSFRDLTNLRYLYLSNNRIRHIDRRAFRTLHKLLYLVLKGNPLDEHVTRFQFNSIYLSYLDLSECGLRQIPRGIGDSLRYLQMRRNNITQLKVQSFADCPYVNILVLDENQIENIEEGTFEKMFHLRQLWLTDNQLQDIPRPLPVGLRRLLLDSNRINEITNIFPIGSHMDTLSLVDNKIAQVSDDAFSNLRALHSLDMSNNRIGVLPGRTFSHNSELKTLHLNMNPLKEFTSQSFEGLTGLQILSLSYIYAPPDSVIEGLPPQAASSTAFQLPQDIFQPLVRLTSLDLDSSGSLIALVFSSDITLASLRHLQGLSLRNSELTNLRPDFPAFFPSLGTLRISSNRWHCDTNLKWFRDFILTSGVRIENKDEIKCFSPRNIHSNRIISLKDEDFVKTTTSVSTSSITTFSNIITDNLVVTQNALLANGGITVPNQEGWWDYEVEPVRQLAKEDEASAVFDSNVDTFNDYVEYYKDPLLINSATKPDQLVQTTMRNSFGRPPKIRKFTTIKGNVGSNPFRVNPGSNSTFDDSEEKSNNGQTFETITEKPQKKGLRKKPGVILTPEGNRGKVENSEDLPEFIGAMKNDNDDNDDDSNDDPFRYRIVAVTLTIAFTIVIACAIVAIIICIWNRNQRQRNVNAMECAEMLPQHTVIKYKNKNGVLYFSSAGGSEVAPVSSRDQDSGVHSLEGSSQPRTPDSVKTTSSSMPDMHLVTQLTRGHKPPVYKREDR